jgi:hypothetical protein
MSEREHTHTQAAPADGGGGPAPNETPGAGLAALRQAGTAMLAAADEAIARVLSGDSQAFNQAVRQEGGE